MTVLQGRVWVLGEGITTDHIAPGRYFHLRSNLPELAKHVLEDARPDLAAQLRPGDFIAAGRNFGLGSSREHAPAIIKLAGVAAVLAPSFARIFFRNAINIGLPVVMVETASIQEGHDLEVDLAQGLVRNLTTGAQVCFEPLSPELLAILQDGGLVAHIQKHGRIKL